jgi:DNA-binding MarR family transcriptional regulator
LLFQIGVATSLLLITFTVKYLYHKVTCMATSMETTAMLGTIRALYDAMDRFDGRVASRMKIDRSALRAVNAMEHGPVGPSELAQRLGLTTGAVTALLDRLEAAGHVQRHYSEADRRRRDASLTSKTYREANRYYADLGGRLQKSFARLRPQERAAAIAFVGDVVEAFDSRIRTIAAKQVKKNKLTSPG